MSEMLPFPKAIELGMPPVIKGGVTVLILEMRKGIMENGNYTEEVGRDFKLINS